MVAKKLHIFLDLLLIGNSLKSLDFNFKENIKMLDSFWAKIDMI